MWNLQIIYTSQIYLQVSVRNHPIIYTSQIYLQVSVESSDNIYISNIFTDQCEESSDNIYISNIFTGQCEESSEPLEQASPVIELNPTRKRTANYHNNLFFVTTSPAQVNKIQQSKFA